MAEADINETVDSSVSPDTGDNQDAGFITSFLRSCCHVNLTAYTVKNESSSSSLYISQDANSLVYML